MLQRALDIAEEFATPFAVALAVGMAMAGDEFGAVIFAFCAARCVQHEIKARR